ncbi:hypothetical protein HMPREF0591_5646 [Mycobacterium parascrofulaceum ATCC BAA-614]|uniref:Uncharacterized protein n=1 Tax=Mycobacterium parascrofulaceum ATCC BAA-614 TaxID=525368 RepID=D5PHK2_9MYCO|nr:hypothetical protein HMPREF0591_5646 [Mycobacterium parascrofulaceum ATCC BAA-614]
MTGGQAAGRPVGYPGRIERSSGDEVDGIIRNALVASAGV